MSMLPILLFTILIGLIFWLLRDYPAWRQKQLEQTKDQEATPSNRTQQPPSDSTLQQQLTKTLDEKEQTSGEYIINKGNQESEDTTASDDSALLKPPTLNLAQYTMMIPMAVVYLIGRTMVDITRGFLYHALYNAELAVPVVDEWLFDKVTVWLPNKYDQVAEWWATKGRQRYNDLQHTLIHQTIPTTIDHIDVFFLHLYNGGQLVAETAHNVAESLRLFREKHDWQQLALDMGNAANILIVQPLVSTLTLIYRLGKVFCQGCWYGLKATWDDLYWVVAIGVPGIIVWVGTTRGWLWMKQGWLWCQDIAKRVVLKVAVVTSPVMRSVVLWMVRLGDSVASWMQSDLVQRMWKYVQYGLSNGGMWLCLESVALMQSIKIMATTMVDHGIVPIMHLFMDYVLPRLSQGYQRFMVDVSMVYKGYMRPIGQRIVIWLAKLVWPLTRLLEHYYLRLLSFANRWNWDGVLKVSGAIIRWSQWLTTWLVATVGPRINKMATTLIYDYLPLTVEYMQQGWNKVMGDLDYTRLTTIVEHIYQVIQYQCSLVFASLERTINDWKEAQQEMEMRADKCKVNKTS
ncbi:hypothetical protein BC941DRAFT_407935 [Chlamydoabsidia padenii]|nr:hypothetical protein BC941DRAFT_407935 [Chlamydoabsidia padenii]